MFMELDILPKTSSPRRTYLIIQMSFKSKNKISLETNCGDVKPLRYQD